ncbi:hypothetical protein L596_028383 [Steinernema carpocapsae]|uniref:Uncharacterized protein n=1 Tax=Steinernema carpocapsae TaxID=34508 RepID=A0A4U5LYB8_STECR|nr:hypothetical protein L596_028383 [Steinernema carpocapsae]
MDALSGDAINKLADILSIENLRKVQDAGGRTWNKTMATHVNNRFELRAMVYLTEQETCGIAPCNGRVMLCTKKAKYSGSKKKPRYYPWNLKDKHFARISHLIIEGRPLQTKALPGQDGSQQGVLIKPSPYNFRHVTSAGGVEWHRCVPEDIDTVQRILRVPTTRSRYGDPSYLSIHEPPPDQRLYVKKILSSLPKSFETIHFTQVSDQQEFLAEMVGLFADDRQLKDLKIQNCDVDASLLQPLARIFTTPRHDHLDIRVYNCRCCHPGILFGASQLDQIVEAWKKSKKEDAEHQKTILLPFDMDDWDILYDKYEHKPLRHMEENCVVRHPSGKSQLKLSHYDPSTIEISVVRYSRKRRHTR